MVNVWIFQGNPDYFDVDGYLRATKKIVWSVKQKHLALQMNIGDCVYLWRAGGKKKGESGIIGLAKIIDLPSIRDEDPIATPFWKSGNYQNEQLRVALEVVHIANKKEIIDRKWLEEDPILSEMLILKMSQGTNYLIPHSQRSRLKMLWDRTGKDWSRDESLVGLWTYVQLIGKPVSKTKDSLVAKSAVLIGRAVTGMYSKVQNFLSLDPNDDRKGLDAASEVDRQVWTEFFDSTNNVIKVEALELEYKKIWGGLYLVEEVEEVGILDLSVESSTESNSIRSKPKTKKEFGQGYIRDARIKRAIELRAVELAIEHYIKNGFEVFDTGAYESFDLSCIKNGKERRVEVKGTTTSGISVILTKTEVDHARSRIVPVDLVIVRNIEVLRSPDGPQALGGDFYILENWFPEEGNLVVATYNYKVKG